MRLHAFLAETNPPAADRRLQALIASPEPLLRFPRLGGRLDGFGSREVRRLIVGDYELRYEIAGEDITVIQIWHGREDR